MAELFEVISLNHCDRYLTIFSINIEILNNKKLVFKVHSWRQTYEPLSILSLQSHSPLLPYSLMSIMQITCS